MPLALLVLSRPSRIRRKTVRVRLAMHCSVFAVFYRASCPSYHTAALTDYWEPRNAYGEHL